MSLLHMKIQVTNKWCEGDFDVEIYNFSHADWYVNSSPINSFNPEYSDNSDTSFIRYFIIYFCLGTKENGYFWACFSRQIKQTLIRQLLLELSDQGMLYLQRRLKVSSGLNGWWVNLIILVRLYWATLHVYSMRRTTVEPQKTRHLVS